MEKQKKGSNSFQLVSSDSELGEDGSSRESPTEELSVGPRYQLLASNKMMGKYSISNVKVGSVACGIMGCLAGYSGLGI